MPEGRSPPQHEQPVLGPGGPHVVEVRVDGVELDVHQDHHVGLQTLEAVDGGVDDAVDMLETRHMEWFVPRGMGIFTQSSSCLEEYNPERLGKFLDRSRCGAIKLDSTDHQQSNRIP